MIFLIADPKHQHFSFRLFFVWKVNCSWSDVRWFCSGLLQVTKQWIFKSHHPAFSSACFYVTISSALVWSNQMVSHKMLGMNISYVLETVFPRSSAVKCVDLKTSHNLRCFLVRRRNSGQRQLSIVVISQCGKQRVFWTAGKIELKFSIKRGKKKKKGICQAAISSLAALRLHFLDIMWKVRGIRSMRFLIHWISSQVNLTSLSQWTLRFHLKLVLLQFRPFLTLFSYLQYQRLQPLCLTI